MASCICRSSGRKSDQQSCSCMSIPPCIRINAAPPCKRTHAPVDTAPAEVCSHKCRCARVCAYL